MNIKQAKARFTELTGLPAKKHCVYGAIWNAKGYFADWVSVIESYGISDPNTLNARHLIYWQSLVAYLESLQEVA